MRMLCSILVLAFLLCPWESRSAGQGSGPPNSPQEIAISLAMALAAQRTEPGDLLAQRRRAEVLPHPRRVPA